MRYEAWLNECTECKHAEGMFALVDGILLGI
jgi:hypothetical protein